MVAILMSNQYKQHIWKKAIQGIFKPSLLLNGFQENCSFKTSFLLSYMLKHFAALTAILVFQLTQK
jgi:hypothetical protein